MGLGPTEIVAIVLVALLLFGPGRIAGVGRGLGDGIRSFKQGLRGLTEDDDAAAASDGAEGVAATPAQKRPVKTAGKPKRVRAKKEPLVGSPARARPVPARQS